MACTHLQHRVVTVQLLLAREVPLLRRRLLLLTQLVAARALRQLARVQEAVAMEAEDAVVVPLPSTVCSLKRLVQWRLRAGAVLVPVEALQVEYRLILPRDPLMVQLPHGGVDTLHKAHLHHHLVLPRMVRMALSV